MTASRLTSGGVIAVFVIAGVFLWGSMSKPKLKPAPGDAGLPAEPKRDTDNRVIVGEVIYQETIGTRTFGIQERTVAGNSNDEVNGLYYVVGIISNGIFSPQMETMGGAEAYYKAAIQFSESEWYRSYDEALAQIVRMRPDDDPTSPENLRPSPPNGGLGGLGSLPTGGSPMTATEDNNPFPSGGFSAGGF